LRFIREVCEVFAAPYDSQPEPQVAGQDMRLLSHSARLPHHLVTLGVLYGQDLRFDINRLTFSTSVASSYWKCNSPASLTRFPCKLDLMPVRYGVLQRTSAGLGRHCFASDNRFQPVLLCGLFAAPSGFHNSILFLFKQQRCI